MHQSGHERAQSMQTVQFSSRRAITPRARVGGASFSRGYCTVSAPSLIVRPSVFSVTPSPLNIPGTLGLGAVGIHTTILCVPRPRRPLLAAPRLAPRRSQLCANSDHHLEDGRDDDV